jgi:choline dehydrogenase-like flavoprotein
MSIRFIDLNDFEGDSVVSADLCIVGTGPAGASVALELGGTGIDVLLVESGGFDYEADTQSCYDIQSVGAPRLIPQENLRRRGLGGSSRVWTGRCAPFSVLDLAERSWIPYSGWPFTLEELCPYLERAALRLGLAATCYDERLWRYLRVARPAPSLDRRFLEPMFWQFSNCSGPSRAAADFGNFLVNSSASNLRVLLHANATHITTSAEGRSFASLDVSTLYGKRAQVRARALVLACGGIENPRLLLASNRLMPRGVGNDHDTVGRFLMDHITCVLATFVPCDARRIRDRFGSYWLDDETGRHMFLHGLALSADIQRREHLLNCHAYVEEYDVVSDDPWSSMRQLKSAIPVLPVAQVYSQAARIVAGHFGEVCRGIYRRQIRHRPELPRVKRVELQCILEQIPDPDSRIVLSDDAIDLLGMPLSKIDWKISEIERHTARRMSQLICQEFRRLGLPAPQLTALLDDDNWMEHFVERAHPAGATRMSLDPKRGVVDLNCQVHGINDLFVAGSSTFPTSGAANPTLMIVAMALRLADWLKAKVFDSRASSTLLASDAY